MAFNARTRKVKKVEAYDAGANQASNDSNELANAHGTAAAMAR